MSVTIPPLFYRLLERPRGCGLAGAVLAAALVAALLALAPAPADAQSSDLKNLIQRVDRLQRELNTLQKQVYRGEAAPKAEGGGEAQGGQAAGGGTAPTLAARMQIRLDRLEQEVSRLTGQMEEVQFQVRKVGDRLDKLVADVDFRLRQLEQGSASAEADGGEQATASAGGEGGQGTGSGQSTASGGSGADGEQGDAGFDSGPKTLGTVSQDTLEALRQEKVEPAGAADGEGGAGTEGEGEQVAAAPAGEAALPEGTPAEQYEHAFGLLRQADYGKAERALGAFLEAHPDHRLAGNAKYWLGETFYVRGNFRQAAVTFAEGFETYPDSNKAPDNLLKLGMSLAELGSKQDACDTLAELLKRYPDAASNIRQTAQRERQRLGCS